jgi:hypothetical protein
MPKNKTKKMETFEGLHALEARLAQTLCMAWGSFHISDEVAWRPEQPWAQAREHAEERRKHLNACVRWKQDKSKSYARSGTH